MKKRSVSDTIQLDQLLRTARNFYFVASVFAVPGAMFSVAWLLVDIGALFSDSESSGLAIWNIILDVAIIAVAYVVVSQVIEANRRIRLLAENPAANVRPIYVPRILRNP